MRAQLVLLAIALMRIAWGAEPEVITLDSARSHAEFHVRVIWLFDISGQFGKVEGTVRVDRFRSQAVVDARIDARAVKMRDEDYEDWAKSDEFFDADRYPDIHFLSDAFPLQRLSKGGSLPGTLTVRGKSGSVLFEIAPGECARPAYECPVEVEGAIRRTEFGMRSRRATISDKVRLAFSVFAIPAPG